MRIPVHLFVLLVATCVLAGSAEKPISNLEREAKEVLADGDNIARRKRIDPVFELATKYADDGRTDEAIKYYRAALEHHPWRLDAQMRLAELLRDTRESAVATEKADLVYRHAETDPLLARAATFLRKRADPTIITNIASPKSPYTLVLVPFAEADAWLLQELRRQLQVILNIRVSIEKSEVNIPKPARDSMRLRIDDLRERITKAGNDPKFQALLVQLNLSTNNLAREEEVIAITDAVLSSAPDKERVRQFREEMAFLRRLGPQWDTAEILRAMREALAPRFGSRTGYLCVTSLDLFSDQSRYVFGSAVIGANHAVFSYRRYLGSINDEPPDRVRLAARALKQALSSTGLLFGVPRCSDPTCARAYANSVPEHDAKQTKLCSECSKGFRDRFAR